MRSNDGETALMVGVLCCSEKAGPWSNHSQGSGLMRERLSEQIPQSLAREEGCVRDLQEWRPASHALRLPPLNLTYRYKQKGLSIRPPAQGGQPEPPEKADYDSRSPWELAELVPQPTGSLFDKPKGWLVEAKEAHLQTVTRDPGP